MDYGLLWYDGDPQRPLEDKIERAVQRYCDKFGRLPNTCYVHSEPAKEEAQEKPRWACRLSDPAAVIHVVSAPNVLLNHFWVGECAKNGQRKNGPGR